MIAITIPAEAYEAVRATPVGQAMVAPPPGPDGLIRICLDREFVDRLGPDARAGRELQRGHSESRVVAPLRSQLRKQPRVTPRFRAASISGAYASVVLGRLVPSQSQQRRTRPSGQRPLARPWSRRLRAPMA